MGKGKRDGCILFNREWYLAGDDGWNIFRFNNSDPKGKHPAFRFTIIHSYRYLQVSLEIVIRCDGHPAISVVAAYVQRHGKALRIGVVQINDDDVCKRYGERAAAFRLQVFLG